MGRILVLYATVDGQTGRIAEHMAAALVQAGHEVKVRPASIPHAADDAALFDGVILGASIRHGRHAKYVTPLVRDCLKALAVPTAFFSVCLSAGGPGARPEAARRYVDRLLRETGWQPTQVRSFGGALRYRRYSAFNRWMIRFIMSVTGGDTDTSREYEYTDWQAVSDFARQFGARLRAETPRVLMRA